MHGNLHSSQVVHTSNILTDTSSWPVLDDTRVIKRVRFPRDYGSALAEFDPICISVVEMSCYVSHADSI